MLLASVLCVAVLTWQAWPRLQAWTSERRAAAAFAEVASCLELGPEVDDDSLRRRAIAARLAGDRWPLDCQRSVTTLVARAHAAYATRARCDGACCVHDRRCASLDRLEQHAVDLKEQVALRQFGHAVSERIVDIADEMGWAVPSAPMAPTRLGHLTRADLPPLAPHGLGRVALCRAGPKPWWLMMQERERGATICGLASEAATARCLALAPTIPVARPLFLIDGGLGDAPRLFAEVDEGWKVYAPSGKEIATLGSETVGATTLEGGAVANVVRRANGYQVFVDATEALALSATSEPLLYAGHVFVQDGDELGIHSITGAQLVARVPLPSAARVTMRGCVGSGVTAVRVRDDTGAGDRILVMRDGAWNTIDLPRDVPPRTMSCHGAEVHLTWMDPPRGTHHRVRNLVCGSTACAERAGDVELTRHSNGSRFFVASLGGNVVLIWRSALGDVRARVGPPDALAERASIPVVEDAEHGGMGWDEAQLRVMNAEHAAIVLIQSRDGIHGIRIDGQGARALVPPE